MSTKSITTSIIIMIFVMILALGGVASAAPTAIGVQLYDQCSNDDGDGYGAPDTGCRWINGNLNKNNSTYFEGDATVQRLYMTGFTPGQTYSVTFSYGTTKGGKHAYDFLTTWNWSESWIQLADLCQDVVGCTTNTARFFDIPNDPNVSDTIEPNNPGDRQFMIRGATITSVTTPFIFSGDYTGDSETRLTVNFTLDSTGSMCSGGLCSMALWFGAHVATQVDWGLNMGAGSISGSPYHVALVGEGSRDNQMQATAVTLIPNGTIVIIKKAEKPALQPFSFNLNNNSTIDTNFQLVDNSSTTDASQTFSVPPGMWYASEINIPTGWHLKYLSCVDPTSNTTWSLANALATINLASSETVTCTFTNFDTPTAVEVSAPSVEAGAGFATLTWDTSLEDGSLTGFNVYRSESEASPEALVNSQVISAKYQGGNGQYVFVDGGLLAGHTYYYWVEAVYKDGAPLLQAGDQPAVMWWFLRLPVAFNR